MTKIYEKWRDLEINPMDIDFKNIKIEKIVSYPPAGNDVVECDCFINGEKKRTIIKIERSKVADFKTEAKHLNLLTTENLKIAKVIEIGKVKNKYYIVLSKIEGERLSDIFLNDIKKEEKEEYLIKYGDMLATIHNIHKKDFNDAKIRVINDYPKSENYTKFDEYILKWVKYLELNKPKINKDTFIHGDFHYANILWNDKEIEGILDFEYSGLGYKEQDIAWACILRPSQKFMDNFDDIKAFLKGYKQKGDYNEEAFKWCLINGYCHFYLMNVSNEEYIKKLKELLDKVENINLEDLN